MILFKAPGQKHKTVLEWSRSEVERPQREKYTGGRFLSRRPEPVKGESKGRTRESAMYGEADGEKQFRNGSPGHRSGETQRRGIER